jgi:serine/threonine protein kinase/tetratricopeptide (TPR) repeat protein
MPVDPERVQAIFLEAAEQESAAGRAALLDRQCGGDAELRRRVETLLRAHDAPGAFLESPAADPAETIDEPSITERPGAVIGPYKLLEQIGEGGFGVVFMAEQTQPIRRKVALKVLKPGMDTRQIVGRFEAERQALAIMDHPNIAKVFDGGATPSGRPYFVMELVKGVPVTEYCDQNHQTPRQRLELFIPVCQAVQHAHQKGIIHRDLKPSNILVTMHDTTPVPKIIDFGVAKALGQELTDKTLFTGFAQMIGTPLYMSPEQAGQSGLDIDTRSDIYSLGVLLYELLTGTTPFEKERFKKAAYDEIRRIIREEEPPKPSTRLSELSSRQAAHAQASTRNVPSSLASISAQRHTEPAKLTKLVRGELDWIVMKALEKDRNRRYETANGFAMDVQRYLNDEAVQACPPSAGYRFRKFTRRNRTGLTMASVVTATLLLGIVATTWQAIRATEERDRAVAAETLAQTRLVSETQAHQAADEARKNALLQRDRALKAEKEAEANFLKARQAVDEYFTLVSESKLLDVPGLQLLRKQLLEAALRYYQTMLKQRADDPAVLVDLALSSLRVANIYFELDRNDDSLAAFDSAVELLERLRRDYPHAAEHHRRLAGYWKVNRSASKVTKMPTNPAAAHRTLTKLLQIWEAFAQESPSVEGFQNDLAAGNRLLAALDGVRGALGDRAAMTRSIAYSRKAIAIWEQLSKEHPQRANYQENLAGAYGELVWVLKIGGQMGPAGEASARSMALWDELYKQFPDVPNYRALGANRLTVLASKLTATDPKEAEKTYRQALQAWDKLVTDFPMAPEYTNELALAQTQLADLLNGPLKQPNAARDAYRKAIKQREKGAAYIAEYPFLRAQLGWSYRNLAEFVAYDPKRAQETEDLRRRDESVFERLVNDYPDDPRWPESWAHALRLHAFDSQRVRRHDEAEKLFREAINVLEKSTGKFPAERTHWHFLADTYRRLGSMLAADHRPAEAGNALRRVVAVHEKRAAALSGAPPPTTGLPETVRSAANESEWMASYLDLAAFLRKSNRPHEAKDLVQKLVQCAVDEKLNSQSAKTSDQLKAMAAVYQSLANLLRNGGEPIEAEKTYRKGLDLLRKRAAEFPAVAGCREDLGHGCRAFTDWLQGPEKHQERAQLLRESITVFESLVADFPGVPYHRYCAASSHEWLGGILAALKLPEQGEDHYREAIELVTALPLDYLANSDARVAADNALNGLAGLLKAGSRKNEAENLLRQAIAFYQKVISSHPSAPGCRQSLALQYVNLAVLLRDAGKTLEAEKHYRQAAAVDEKLVAEFPDQAFYRQGLLRDWLGVATILATKGQVDQAEMAYRKVIELGPKDELSNNNVAWFLATCPEPKFRDPKRAVELARKAVELAPKAGNYWNTLGVAHYRIGDWKAAIEALNKSDELLKGKELSFNAFFIAMAYWQLNNKNEARKWYDRAVEWMEKNKPKDTELIRFRAEAAELIKNEA